MSPSWTDPQNAPSVGSASRPRSLVEIRSCGNGGPVGPVITAPGSGATLEDAMIVA